MYANQNKGHVLLAVLQTNNREQDFYEGDLLGTVMNQQSGEGTSQRGNDAAHIIKQLLTCKAANHDLDPDTDSATASASANDHYYGDYIYNAYMGIVKYDTQCYDYYSNPKLGTLPGDVALLMESWKPQVTTDGQTVLNSGDGTAYKDYFNAIKDIFVNPIPPTTSLQLNRIATPHQRSTKMNVLYADGHISLVDPRRDFFTNTTQTSSARYYLWGEPKVFGTGSGVPNWPSTPSGSGSPPQPGYFVKGLLDP